MCDVIHLPNDDEIYEFLHSEAARLAFFNRRASFIDQMFRGEKTRLCYIQDGLGTVETVTICLFAPGGEKDHLPPHLLP